MTVIAAAVDAQGDVYIAADSDSVGEETYYRFVERKVRLYTFPDGSQLGMGGAGDSTQTHTAWDYAWEKWGRATPGSDKDVRAWMQEFAMQWTAECNGMEPTHKDDDGMIGSCAIVGYRGRLYRLQQHECRELEMQYAAVGAGVHYAMGALYATEQLDISEPDRVVLACKAAITHDKYCNGGVDMIRVPA